MLDLVPCSLFLVPCSRNLRIFREQYTTLVRPYYSQNCPQISLPATGTINFHGHKVIFIKVQTPYKHKSFDWLSPWKIHSLKTKMNLFSRETALSIPLLLSAFLTDRVLAVKLLLSQPKPSGSKHIVFCCYWSLSLQHWLQFQLIEPLRAINHHNEEGFAIRCLPDRRNPV
jgi:hypothetical protein